MSGRSTGGARSSRAASSAPPRRGFLGNLLNPGGQQVKMGGPVEVEGNPGRTALLVSMVLAVGSGVAILFLAKAQLDDRGELLPATGFSGLYLRAREALGGSAKTTETSMLDAHGAAVFIWALFPAIIAVGAFFVYRQRRENNQSTYWPLTIAMILMALAVMVGATYALPAMVAIAIAGFQVRKAEMPARMAQSQADAKSSSDEYEEDDSDYEDDEDDGEYEDYDDELEYDDEDEDVEADDEDVEAEAEAEDSEAPKKR